MTIASDVKLAQLEKQVAQMFGVLNAIIERIENLETAPREERGSIPEREMRNGHAKRKADR